MDRGRCALGDGGKTGAGCGGTEGLSRLMLR
jgi:hypothetical protein